MTQAWRPSALPYPASGRRRDRRTAPTGSHAQTSAAAQIHQVVHIQLAQGVFDFTCGHHLAFADEGVTLGLSRKKAMTRSP